ncbi:B3 domain-containing transcription factor VAL3-like [Bidens hawaiensis]|uniref:B3 domain-containing transcription factor VAL3-like n=1 Tax=Bidens hawaiensis TaxID=980011 RepID=UPI00404B3E62
MGYKTDQVVHHELSCQQADHIPLFEKLMSESDAKLKHSRIVIPTKYAKAYFPEVSEGQVIPLDVLDTDGNEWHFSYRCWISKCRTEYVLQGVNYFKRAKNLQAGDTVAFYRRESDEKLILELKKTSAGTSSHDQAST